MTNYQHLKKRYVLAEPKFLHSLKRICTILDVYLDTNRQATLFNDKKLQKITRIYSNKLKLVETSNQTRNIKHQRKTFDVIENKMIKEEMTKIQQKELENLKEIEKQLSDLRNRWELTKELINKDKKIIHYNFDDLAF